MPETVAVCHICGAKDRDSWWWCSDSGDYVCKECCRMCRDYSPVLLPNGVHCRRLWAKESENDRILNVRLIALPSEVAKAKEFWKKRPPETWMDSLRSSMDKRTEIEEPERRARAAAHILALQELIKAQKN